MREIRLWVHTSIPKNPGASTNSAILIKIFNFDLHLARKTTK
jgi:hypothetical protein